MVEQIQTNRYEREAAQLRDAAGKVRDKGLRKQLLLIARQYDRAVEDLRRNRAAPQTAAP